MQKPYTPGPMQRTGTSLVNLSLEAETLLAELKRETDRGAALLGVAFLDDVVDAILRAHFVADERAVQKLMGPGRPVESFGTRTHLAYCLGLLGPDTYADMNLIREIRNDFAHRQPVNFDAPALAEKIGQLNAPNLLSAEEGLMSPRHRFMVAVVLTVNHLTAFGATVAHSQVGKGFRSNGVLRLR